METITDVERTNDIKIASTLFILYLSRSLTSGLRRIAIITEKIKGMMMLCATYKIVKRANRPTKKIDALI
jgi:hypothetical protein